MWCKFAPALLAGLTLAAQTPPPPPGLTISEAVAAALRNYPSIRVSQEQMNAAAAGIRLHAGALHG
jgi:outer membrane protein TolC